MRVQVRLRREWVRVTRDEEALLDLEADDISYVRFDVEELISELDGEEEELGVRAYASNLLVNSGRFHEYEPFSSLNESWSDAGLPQTPAVSAGYVPKSMRKPWGRKRGSRSTIRRNS